MASVSENMPQVGDVLSLNVQETVSTDFLGVLDVECLDRLRFLPGRRSVWRASCAGRDILLKLYDPHMKQQRDARAEWSHAIKLDEADLDIPEPLFFAEGEAGTLAVGFAYISNGLTLDEMLGGAGVEGQTEAFVRLVDLHARQHDVGCYQSDDHLGNYLWAEGELWMLDAGSCVFRPEALLARDRVRNMAILAANVPLPLRSIYDVVFKTHYDVKLPAMGLAIDKAIQTRLSNYYKKTRRACSAFEHQLDKTCSWLACRDLDADLKQRLLTDPDQFFNVEDRLKDGNTCTVVEVRGYEKNYILKRYNEKSLSYRLMHLFSTPRALSSWSNGHVLRLFGVPTPRPMACLLLQSGRLFRKGYLLMEKVSGVALDSMNEDQTAELIPLIAKQFDHRWHELDDLMSTHGDMKSGNFIFSDQGELTLIDLDGVTFHRNGSGLSRKQKKDKARFLENWERHPEWGGDFYKQVQAISG